MWIKYKHSDLWPVFCCHWNCLLYTFICHSTGCCLFTQSHGSSSVLMQPLAPAEATMFSYSSSISMPGQFFPTRKKSALKSWIYFKFQPIINKSALAHKQPFYFFLHCSSWSAAQFRCHVTEHLQDNWSEALWVRTNGHTKAFFSIN